MELFALLLRGVTTSKRRLFLMLVAAGISNAGVIFTINAASGHADKPSENTGMMLLFVATIVVYALSQRYIMVTASGQVENIVHNVRKRLIQKLLRCELRDVEAIGASTLQAGLVNNTQTISQFATPMVLACQAAVMVTFALGYIAWLSVATFIASIAFLGIALTMYFRRLNQVTAGLQQATARERDLQDALSDILSGFKEIKINSRRSADISADAEGVSYDVSWLRSTAQVGLARNFVFAQISLFMLLATGVFLVPMLSSTENSVVTKTAMAVLFLIGPISGLVACVPVFVNANAAARDLTRLDRKLDALLNEGMDGEPVADLPMLKFRQISVPFSNITFENVVFHHTESQSGDGAFSVGPLNLELKAGEITFIIGGNGSGKSTLLKLLTGLYQPDSGNILVDGVPVNRGNLQDYRDLFWTVFSDYHLFRRFYGVEGLDPDEGARLLDEFELNAKTAINGDRFQTVDLSGGQRRRLALMAALMEKRPIGVLDEWAADQDPHFRKKFYQDLLPAMKAKGMTLIVVTHDDRYFDVCDRLIKLDEGRVVDAGVNHV